MRPERITEAKEGGRPPQVEETAQRARLCIAVDLLSDAGSVKRDALSNDSELKEEGRSVWLVATLGPFGPGVKRDSYGAPRRTVQRSVD